MGLMPDGWIIRHSHGDAAAFHASTPVAERSVTFHTVERPTLVLGSAQTDADADATIAAALGVDVVRRRSGGGAVLLLPGEFVWADVVVPAGDALWLDDVARSMLWLGRAWTAALAELGVPGRVHEGQLEPSTWSKHVCWAGVGTGEVMGGIGKLVGISQRRSRELARFQTMCHFRWRPEMVAALVAAPRPSAAELAASAACVPASAAQVMAALVAHLPA